LTQQDKPNEALPHFVEGLRLQPNNAEAHSKLALGLAREGKNGEAIAHLNEAVRLKPNDAQFHFHLATVLAAEKRPQEAVAQYQHALRLKPESVLALNNLAWIFATDEAAQIRNGAEAVKLAERACELTEHKQAFLIGTLAAAYAEAGRFPEAVKTAQAAAERATGAGQKDLAATNQKLMELYKSGNPYREAGQK
jgi:Flp pilus assembly protein TadD